MNSADLGVSVRMEHGLFTIMVVLVQNRVEAFMAGGVGVFVSIL